MPFRLPEIHCRGQAYPFSARPDPRAAAAMRSNSTHQHGHRSAGNHRHFATTPIVTRHPDGEVLALPGTASPYRSGAKPMKFRLACLVSPPRGAAHARHPRAPSRSDRPGALSGCRPRAATTAIRPITCNRAGTPLNPPGEHGRRPGLERPVGHHVRHQSAPLHGRPGEAEWLRHATA